MKIKTKSEKGITLIALIITIIILLILAVVSIKLVVDQGIITFTKEATLQHKVAEIDEVLKIKVNEEQIIRATEKGEILDPYSGSNEKVWENTPYMNFIEISLNEFKKAWPSSYKGNVYSKSGELLIEKVYWFPTDIIMPYDNVPAEIIPPEGYNGDQVVEEMLGVKPFGIKIDIGETGSFLRMQIDGDLGSAGEGYIPSTDIFIIDANYNIYYIDEQGNIIGANKIYKKDDIELTDYYINPETLSEKEREVYNGIYEGALAFTGDEAYSKRLAQNDLNPTTTINTFLGGGYTCGYLLKDDIIATLPNGTELNNLQILMINPDGRMLDLSNLTEFYLMDSSYNMYRYNDTTKTLYDKNNNILIEGVDYNTTSNEIKEKIVTDSVTGTQYKYTYTERFDKRDVLIDSVPEKEVVDMKKDLADLNVFSINYNNANSTVKKIILPETVKTLSPLAISRTMDSSSILAIEVFGYKMPNVEYIELSNNIIEIYANTFKNCKKLKTVIMPDNINAIGPKAFEGCSGVTLKFKDGKAPSGSPWGGSNINITSK